jgi:undecaprenyl pyrophosphate synthase
MSNENLVKAIGKKLGAGEEGAELAAAVLGELGDASDDTVAKTVSLAAAAGEGLGKAPQPLQQALTPIIASSLLKQLNKDPFQEKMLSLVTSLTTLKYILGDSDRESSKMADVLLSQIKELKDTIENLKEEKKAEDEQRLNETLQTIYDEIRMLKTKVETGTAPQRTLADYVEKSPVEHISTFSKELNSLVDALKELGFKVKRPGEEEHEVPGPEVIEKLRATAEKLGLEVRPKSMTYDEYQRRLEEEKKRIMRIAKRKAERHVKVQEAKAKQMETIGALFAELMRTVREYIEARMQSPANQPIYYPVPAQSPQPQPMPQTDEQFLDAVKGGLLGGNSGSMSQAQQGSNKHD